MSIIVILSSKNGSIGNMSISGIPSMSFLFKFSMLLMTQSSRFGFFWPQIWRYEAENQVRDLLIFILWNVKFFFVLFSDIKHFCISSSFWHINCFQIIVYHRILSQKWDLWWILDGWTYSRKELLNITTLTLFCFNKEQREDVFPREVYNFLRRKLDSLILCKC